VFFRAALVLAAIAMAAVGRASPTNAQSPVAAAITASSPAIFGDDGPGDDECGDGWEWSKTVSAHRA
jgi:hypothetical protein